MYTPSCLADNVAAAEPEALKAQSVCMRMCSLGLRYFTPREVANMHSFPPGFSFPSDVTVRQQYACLGNSLSVLVVAELLAFLLEGHGTASGPVPALQ